MTCTAWFTPEPAGSLHLRAQSEDGDQEKPAQNNRTHGSAEGRHGRSRSVASNADVSNDRYIHVSERAYVSCEDSNPSTGVTSRQGSPPTVAVGIPANWMPKMVSSGPSPGVLPAMREERFERESGNGGEGRLLFCGQGRRQAAGSEQVRTDGRAVERRTARRGRCATRH